MNGADHAIMSIYDAATSSDEWDNALDQCVEFVGAQSATIGVLELGLTTALRHDMLSQSLRNVGVEILSRYHQEFVEYEREGWEYVMSLPRQTLISDTEIYLLSDSELCQRADYAFLLEHTGILRRLVARLNDNRAWSDNIAFQFHKSIPIVPVHCVRAARKLLPHLAKAIEMGRSFRLLKARYNAVLSALDHVKVGLCIALADGTVIVSNAEAKRIFDKSDGIVSSCDDRLVTRNSQTNAELQTAIAEASLAASGQASTVEIVLSLCSESNQNPYLVEVSPLRDSAGELESELSGALVMIVDVDNTASLNTKRMANAYGLTNAEQAVVDLLIVGWTNRHIADTRDVSLDTVKTQIASIMRKTGTQRRSQLVRLVLKVSPPIALN